MLLFSLTFSDEVKALTCLLHKDYIRYHLSLNFFLSAPKYTIHESNFYCERNLLSSLFHSSKFLKFTFFPLFLHSSFFSELIKAAFGTMTHYIFLKYICAPLSIKSFPKIRTSLIESNRVFIIFFNSLYTLKKNFGV